MVTCCEEDLRNPAPHDILVSKTQASFSKQSHIGVWYLTGGMTLREEGSIALCLPVIC